MKIVTPRYQQIAVDIAGKIVDKRYEMGDKLHARSTIAIQYGVSSETARRAIAILSDVGIVKVLKGSGATIISYENAVKFIKQYNDIQTLNELKNEILKNVDQQINKNVELKDQVIKLVERIDRFKSINPFVPFEIQIDSSTPLLHKTSSEVNFWHNTSATIVAIKRDDEMLISPGPLSSFCDGDVIYFVGDQSSYERVYHFFYPEE
ncbi:MAG: TrkA C-terminal domain-containing protein [Anaerovoracaceae bacterium]